jgi:hypothetical protein
VQKATRNGRKDLSSWQAIQARANRQRGSEPRKTLDVQASADQASQESFDTLASYCSRLLSLWNVGTTSIFWRRVGGHRTL